MTDTPKHTYRDANGDLWFRESLSEGIGNGLRIDHFLLSPQLADRLVSCEIDREPRGREKASDHTPVICEIAA